MGGCSRQIEQHVRWPRGESEQSGLEELKEVGSGWGLREACGSRET